MGPGRGRLPSGPGPTVLPSRPPLRRPSIPAVGALVVTTVATAVVVGGASWLSNGADVVLIAVACVAYVLLISRRTESGLPIRLVSAAVALQTFVAVARPPGATQDLWYYAIYGRMLAVYHASPYTHVPADHPGDPFLTQIGRAWHHTPSVYGPAFTAVSGAASFVLGGSFLETRLFYQCLAAGALALACVLVWRRTRSADAVAFLALNPLTALYLVNGGRNDILVGVALLGAVVLARSEHPIAAGVVGGLGALVKLTGLVGVVALVVSLAVCGRRDDARRLGVAAGLSVVGAYLLAGSAAVFTPMDTAGALFSRESVWRLIPRFGGHLPTTEVALVVVGVVVCWVLLRAARSGPELAVPATLTALTLGAAYTLSGYVAWALPAAALRHRSLVARLAAYQAVVLVMTYEIVRRPIPGALGDDLVQLAMFVGPAAVLALLVVLVAHVGRPSVDDALRPRARVTV